MKKVLTLIGTAFLAAAVLASCGGKKDDKVIKVAASSSPHAEILEQCVEPLKAEGYTLEIKVMDDYVIPNNSTESGDVDANYFQHQPYLDSFNKDNGTHLVSTSTPARPILLTHFPKAQRSPFRTTLPTKHAHFFFSRTKAFLP